MSRRTLAVACTLIALALPARDAAAQATQRPPGPPPEVSTTDAPAGAGARSVQWIKIMAPDLGVMLAAVARPRGAGPFPTVVLLHGTHGFAAEYVSLAEDLAAGGVMAVAPCWFRQGGRRQAFITPIDCPEAPPTPEPFSAQAMRIVDTLVQAARSLPDARADRIALFGHSRGGGAALGYVLRVGNVRAAVLDSSVYPAGGSADIKAPILILHGTADNPADGGGPGTNIERVRGFEAMVRAAGRSVEAVYYEGGRHNDIFLSRTQHDDQVRKILEFLQRQLRD